MTYSLDFRKRIIRVQKDEGLTFQQTAKRFRIGIASLTRWHKNPKPIAIRKRPAIKIDMEKLAEDVQQYPDAFLVERAKRFNVSINGIFEALQRLGVTYKKNSQAPQSRRREAQLISEKNKNV